MLIIGIPFVILFLGSIRMLSLLEGRIVEVMLGERMPRRPLHRDRGTPLMARIKDMFLDPRTWSTVLYFIAILPLALLSLTLAERYVSVALSLLLALMALLPGVPLNVCIFGIDVPARGPWLGPPLA